MARSETAPYASADTMRRHRTSWRYRAFGLTWSSGFAWPTEEAEAAGAPDVEIRLSDDVDALWSGHGGTDDWLFGIDGRRFAIQQGEAGDFRLVQQDGPRFHLTRDAKLISCTREVGSQPQSQRLLLDTVLWTTSLLHGLDALHASAVQGPQGAVAFVAGSGGGKTSLAFELLRRGYSLFADDILAVDRHDGDLVVHPSPALMNLPGSACPDGVGVEPIAAIGGESWVSVRSPARAPTRLAHVFIVSRRKGVRRGVSTLAPTALDYLPYALVHGLVDAQESRRFDLCSDLAVAAPASRLEADLDASPSELADLVEAVLTTAETR